MYLDNSRSLLISLARLDNSRLELLGRLAERNSGSGSLGRGGDGLGGRDGGGDLVDDGDDSGVLVDRGGHLGGSRYGLLLAGRGVSGQVGWASGVD
jgi:hypothetical protein